MGGVAQQRHPAVDPFVDRLAIAQHPHVPILAVGDDALRTLADMGEATAHLLDRHGLAGNRLGCIVVVGDDEVEHLPARQRVVDDVALRAGP